MRLNNIMEYSSFKTGDAFKLRELFSKNNVVIIPDLQRDYCWGNENAGTNHLNLKDRTLASAFIWNLYNNGFKKNTDLNLGLVYGYETPKGHIQLCDGQQRITTIFLLIGMLNRRSLNTFQNQLISRYEFEEDDKEPYLQYSIRESSLYFLSDLVCNFFIPKNDLKVSDIQNQNWYFKDYDLDPSVQSILKALESIEEMLTKIDKQCDFGEYLLKKITFIYYDMGSREIGEETFVIINTTGEPLSSTENLKPLFINSQPSSLQDKCSEKWEEWETWFWKQRKGNGLKVNDTAENGFKEFLRWITLLNNHDQLLSIQETGEYEFNISMSHELIDKYFLIINFLFSKSELFGNERDWLAPDIQDNNKNTQIVLFKLLPVVQYIFEWDHVTIRNIIRVKNFFNNLARIDNVSKAIADLLPRAIDLIKEMQSPDIAQIVNQNVSSQLLTPEEKRKFEIYLKNEATREEIENAFWKAEEHKIWKGEILAMINWSTIPKEEFDLKLFEQYRNIFNILFHDNLTYDQLDITRRALLTRKMKNYPGRYKGYKNTCFCYQYSDWQSLIRTNESEFGLFLKELINSQNVDDALLEMIDHFSEKEDWSEFVKMEELLAFCNRKNIQHDSQSDSWILVRGDKTSGEHLNVNTYRLFLKFKSNPFWNTDWRVNTYHYDDSSIHFQDEDGIEIDVVYVGNELFEAQVFGKDDNLNPEVFNIVNAEGLTLKNQRYHSIPMNQIELEQLLNTIINYRVDVEI